MVSRAVIQTGGKRDAASNVLEHGADWWATSIFMLHVSEHAGAKRSWTSHSAPILFRSCWG